MPPGPEPDREPANPDRQRRMALVTLLLSTALALGTAEFVLRLFVPRPLPYGFVGNCENARRYGWGYPAHFPLPAYDPDENKIVANDRTNSRGWKDVEHEFEKAPGTTRILVIGDSYTQGVPPLERVYHRELETLLSDEGFRVEVIAMGYGGWATDQGYEAFLREGRLYSPDIVISQFCVNDLSGLAGLDTAGDRTLKPFAYRLEGDELVRESRPRPDTRGTLAERGIRFMVLHSRIYFCFLKTRETPYLQGHDPATHLWFLSDQPKAGELWKPGEEDPHASPLWRLYGAVLREWNTKCEEIGARFCVYTADHDASELQFGLDWGYFKEEDGKHFARNHAGDWEEIDYGKMTNTWARLCEDLGVDRVPQKRNYTRYKNDPHTNAEGNAKMAEDLRGFLLETEEYRDILESNRR